jgi:8-oxo-dGTP diphosphatase
MSHDPEEDTVPVLAAVVRRGGRFLVARRPRGKRHGGLWEFPGGKVAPGESLLAAARRELSEELGIAVTGIGRLLFEARDPGAPFLLRFVEVRADGEPRALEHLEVGWYRPAELLRMALAPGDMRFVEEALQPGDPRAHGKPSSRP